MLNPLFAPENKYNSVHDDKQIKGFFNQYRWLSNFHPCSVNFEGMWFDSVEHSFQGLKYLRNYINEFGEINGRIELQKTCRGKTSAQIKQWGKKGSLPIHWNEDRLDFMSAMVFDKFYRNLVIRQNLIDTKDKYLEESNYWHDNFWGNCTCKKCIDIEGKNMLGKILMRTREFWK